jgi:hypothetical protein
MPAQSQVRPAEPHAAKAYQINARCFRLSLIFPQRLIALPEMNMTIKDLLSK